MSKGQEFLSSHVMRATSSSLELASSVLGLDIVELWYNDANDGLKCSYAHVSADVRKKYPDVIYGHYPEHKKEHVLSPALCNKAKEANSGYYWHVLNDDQHHMNMLDNSFSCNIKTEISYILTNEKVKANVYIVGFALERLEFKVSKINVLQGISFAIYSAAFEGDDECNDSTIAIDSADESNGALDVKAFVPRASSRASLSPMSTAALYNFPPPHEQAAEQQRLVVADTSLVPLQIDASSSIANEPIVPSKVPSRTSSGQKLNMPDVLDLNGSHSNGISKSGGSEDDSDHGSCLLSSVSSKVSSHYTVPTWEPADNFSFPVLNIPPIFKVPSNLTLDSFTDLKHIADGSNATIFLGKYKSKKVVIKMIKLSAQKDPIATHEFDVEHGVLNRLQHPNVIILLGSGTQPRRFLVLEYLGGGSLSTILNQHQVRPGIAQLLFRKPSFTYGKLLLKAHDIAEALKYLHYEVHEGATVIHRDLKPDNIGFTADGQLKLFDFGLCTCVKRRSETYESYEMTGNTGSLRYMAPEVALKLPYNETADVYSFAILIWQMARDRTPFKGLSRDQFFNNVVHGGERPKIDKSWPVAFSSLLQDCWNVEPHTRPTFDVIVKRLNGLINDLDVKKTWAPVPNKKEVPSIPSPSNIAAAAPVRGKKIGSSTESTSSWF